MLGTTKGSELSTTEAELHVYWLHHWSCSMNIVYKVIQLWKSLITYSVNEIKANY